MRVLLVYPNVIGARKLPLGLAYISSVLKKEGHNVSLLDTTFGITEEEVYKKGRDADVVGVSVQTLQRDQALWISSLLKDKFDIPIIWGGNHPTVMPEECIGYDCVDAICIGEGEEATKEFVNKLEAGQETSGVANFWTKTDGHLTKNEVRPLIQDLDQLPYPDREIFDREHLCIDSGSPFSGSRGCPFNCPYCINNKLLELYRGKGSFARFRSVDNLLGEIKDEKEKFNIKVIEFADETFTLRKKWVEEFCNRYKKEIGLPFVIQTRCDTVDHQTLKMLRAAGCTTVSFGVESGNPEFRKNILNRRMEDETIIRAFEMATELGFEVYSFNMVGMPYETENQILDTIRLNRKLKASKHDVCIFYPFPGTGLGDLCREKGWIRDTKGVYGYYYDTILDLPQLDRLTILTYQKFWPYYLIFPETFFPAMTALFKNFLKVGYYVRGRSNSKTLGMILDNLYILTKATTDPKTLSYLLSDYLPSKLKKKRGRLK